MGYAHARLTAARARATGAANLRYAGRMTDRFQIRPAEAGDVAEVAALAAKLVALHHDFDAARFFLPERVAEGYAWWFGQELGRPEVLLLVAVVGGRIAGYAYGRLEARDWNQLLDASGALHDLWVEPEARGSGVAKALVDAIVTGLVAKGAPRVVLHAAEANRSAQALFASLGFRRTMVEMTREA